MKDMTAEVLGELCECLLHHAASPHFESDNGKSQTLEDVAAHKLGGRCELLIATRCNTPLSGYHPTPSACIQTYNCDMPMPDRLGSEG